MASRGIYKFTSKNLRTSMAAALNANEKNVVSGAMSATALSRDCAQFSGENMTNKLILLGFRPSATKTGAWSNGTQTVYPKAA